jgi:nicotinate-nucleotide--dimethylbenzimidazole phosphoribosyltransferase
MSAYTCEQRELKQQDACPAEHTETAYTAIAHDLQFAYARAAALLQTPVSLVTGRGTGINDEQLTYKIQVIEKALARHAPNPQAPFDALMKVGGLEIAGLVGVIVASASHRVPVVIDGFISGAAALMAVEFNPLIREYLLAGHASVERGHHLILERLGLSPLLDLQLRLGEGTGA